RSRQVSFALGGTGDAAGRAGPERGDDRGRDHGGAAPVAAARGGAVPSGKRPYARRQQAHGQLHADGECMSGAITKLLDRLLDGQSLEEAQAYDFMHALAGGDIHPALAGALLAALRAKGETADEIRGFATAMRELALCPAVPPGAAIVDTVGTGGDGSGSFNLSTGAGLLAAACGARVVKHGNRSISSRCG